MTVAQRFIAGKAMGFVSKSVKRTTGRSCYPVPHSAVRYPDCVFTSLSPSSKLLAYCHSSSARTGQPIAPLEWEVTMHFVRDVMSVSGYTLLLTSEDGSL